MHVEILLLLVAAYLAICYAVSRYRKRHDPRYHYASNEDPEGKAFRTQLLNVGGYMEEEQLDAHRTIQVTHHAATASQTVPDGLLTLLAPLYWRIRFKPLVPLVLILGNLVLFYFGWFATDALQTIVHALRVPTVAAVFGLLFLSYLFDIYQSIQMPSRHWAYNSAHRTVRFLTFKPNPDGCPAAAREAAREEAHLLAEHDQSERENWRRVAQVDRPGTIDVRNGL